MLSYDKLQTIFERGKKPYWALYRGQNKGQQIGTNCLLKQEDNPTLETAWQDLEELITAYGDGVYTLECRTNPASSRGNDLHTFLVGTAEPQQGRVSGMSNATHPAAGFFQGLDARYFMEQINGANSSAQSLQIQLIQKQFEIENLKRELKEKREKITPADRVIGIFENNPKILDRILGGDGRAAIGTLSSSQPIHEAAENRTEENATDEDTYTPGKIDFNALVEDAMRIQAALPGQHVNEVIENLATWIETNPTQAENYLKMLQ